MVKKCGECGRTLVCDENLKLLRIIVICSILGGGTLGVFALPLIGFGLGGVAAGSLAALWQSLIGNVAAGSLFAILQSLGATGLGSILFGTFGAAAPLLVGIAVRYLNWCDDEQHKDQHKDEHKDEDKELF
ncbi:interferon alpha-inducible protein 27, mitochondrial-like [Temnothorax curvispinosus]|uniref:Interferon alpha-inducible protein 27, mitochondrial-like n=2 Tax=Temnothorax TaxID=300110 RepID=A0A6J1Q048_9HYME|nr:interferon alpha-inducible protein 27, mitochondrial-like [Temnothorax curvispinosus]XP_024875063.1 interferon alpha-inducible protein 27, mitochondrial-like [Temnothorax curvispinosus]TGZ37514.1 hypothetical protein DBV15_04638 [Temnothorax longispinosus]